jgi:hypothetical protein
VTTLIIVGIVLAALAWFVWPARAPARPARRARPGVDEAELEAAERDVQEAPNAETVRDWGPGTGQKPLP